MPIMSEQQRIARALEALVKIEDQKLRAITSIESHLIDISDHLERMAAAPIEGELDLTVSDTDVYPGQPMVFAHWMPNNNSTRTYDYICDNCGYELDAIHGFPSACPRCNRMMLTAIDTHRE